MKLKQIKYPARKNWPVLLRRPAMESAELESKVREIIGDVQKRGDQALQDYSEKFDGFSGALKVNAAEILAAEGAVSEELKRAIVLAKRNIEKFHLSQKEKQLKIETMPGVKCWRKAVGIEKVGLYIPGGTAPLLSTVLMLGVPAGIARCRKIVLCTPADKDGNISPAILYAASCCGIKNVFRIGGAQAIAAMAFGTKTIPKVDKIFGPGNQYVTCAKQLVNASGVSIDMPAGPSELAILADETCVPEFVAADLLSQAEHGPDSQVMLVSDSPKVIEKVNNAIRIQLDALPRKRVAAKALTNGKAFLMNDMKEGLDLLNEYAPEHLIIVSKNKSALAAGVVNAGSVFLGNYSCESAGDYASGTNHTLPTNGFSRTYSGVSLDSFVKKITFQEITKTGLMNIGSAIGVLAEAEGLIAHKNAVSLRINNSNKNKNGK